MKVQQHVWLSPLDQRALITLQLPEPADKTPVKVKVNAYDLALTELAPFQEALEEAKRLIHATGLMTMGEMEAA